MKLFIVIFLYFSSLNLYAEELEFQSPSLSYKLEIFPTSIRYTTINRTIEIQKINCLNLTINSFETMLKKKLKTKVVHGKSPYVLKHQGKEFNLMKDSDLHIFLSRMKNIFAEIQLKSRTHCD